MNDRDKLTQCFEDNFCHELILSKADAIQLASDLISMCLFGDDEKPGIGILLTVTDEFYKSAMYRGSRISKVIAIVQVKELRKTFVDSSLDADICQKQIDSIARILEDR